MKQYQRAENTACASIVGTKRVRWGKQRSKKGKMIRKEIMKLRSWGFSVRTGKLWSL